MAGPLFLVLASVARESRVEVARKIAKSGAEHDIGLIFGSQVVQFILKDYPGFVEEMMGHISQPIVFLVTDHPLENDVMDLFEMELNPARHVDPAKSRILRFLNEIWSIQAIPEFLIAIWDFISPSYEDLPKYEMSFDEFYGWVRNWYGWERSSIKPKRIKGHEGIFNIRRSDSKAGMAA